MSNKYLTQETLPLLRQAISIGLLCGTVHATYAETFCVSTATELQNALNTTITNTADDEIQIVQGTYVGNFTYLATEANSLTIKGGYTANCASRKVDATNTVLDGDSNGIVLTLTSTQTADFVVDGVTVQKGVAATLDSKTGGLYISTSYGNVILSNNLITNNTASAGWRKFPGHLHSKQSFDECIPKQELGNENK